MKTGNNAPDGFPSLLSTLSTRCIQSSCVLTNGYLVMDSLVSGQVVVLFIRPPLTSQKDFSCVQFLKRCCRVCCRVCRKDVVGV